MAPRDITEQMPTTGEMVAKPTEKDDHRLSPRSSSWR